MNWPYSEMKRERRKQRFYTDNFTSTTREGPPIIPDLYGWITIGIFSIKKEKKRNNNEAATTRTHTLQLTSQASEPTRFMVHVRSKDSNT